MQANDIQLTQIPELKPGLTIVLDNASIRRTLKIKELFQKAKCKLVFLPPYSPDLNKIKPQWVNS